MTDFLFEILILKSYRKNEDILILPKDIKIIIEIPNGFIDYKSKFPILNLIPLESITKLSIKDLPPLNVEDNNTQIVCNYLKLREEKKIDIQDLKFDFTPKELLMIDEKIKVGNKIVRKTLSTLFMDAKKLWQPECQN